MAEVAFVTVGERIRYIGTSKYRSETWPKDAWLEKGITGTVTEFHEESPEVIAGGERFEAILPYAVVTWDFSGQTAIDPETENIDWQREHSSNPGTEYWREFTELSKSDQEKIETSIRPKPYTDYLWQTDAKGSLLLNEEGRPLMSKHKYPGAYQKRLLGGNPKEITKEEAIGLLERLSMTPGEAAHSLVADEAERKEIMQTVQQRVKREQNKWAPMDPREGPPLPRIFAGLRWPWKK